MNRQQTIYGFEFNNQLALNDQIQTITTVEINFLVTHWKRFLPLETDSSQRQLSIKTFFVGRFQKSRTKDPVNLDASTNDRLREFVKTQRLCVSAVDDSGLHQSFIEVKSSTWADWRLR